MRRLVKPAVALVLILGISVIVYIIVGRPPDDPARSTSRQNPSDRPSSPNRVTALGRLAPRSEVINVGTPQGDRLVRLTVAPGQSVEAHQVLAYLDSYDERLADKERIGRQLAEAQAQLTAETAYGNALVAESQARLRQLETSSRLEIEAQDAHVHALDAELATSQRELLRVTRLLAAGARAQQDLDRQELVVQRNQLDLQAARVVLEKLRQAHDLDVRVARAQVEAAQTGLVRAQRAVQIDSLREGLRLAEARVQRSLIRAPVSGQVFKIIARPGEETGTRPILQMGDTSQMYAIAEVYETDVPWVRTNQRATISSPALSRPLEGTVETVGRAISKNLILDVDPAAATDRRVAEVWIRLDPNQVAATLVNLQVTVDIDAASP